MAKYRSKKNISISKRGLAIGIAVVMLIVGVFAALAVGSKGFTDMNPAHYFNGWGKGIPPVAEAPDDNKKDETQQILNNGLIVSEEEGNTALMHMNISAYSETQGEMVPASQGYLFEAVITPAESVITDFTYTAKFKDEASEWASGKSVSDYLTLTVDSNNPLKATAKLKQAFGEPIIVTCTYDKDTSIQVSRQLDYLKPIDEITVVFDRVATAQNSLWFDSGSYVYIDYEYGVGTIKGNFSFDEGYFCLSDEAYNYLLNNQYYKQWETMNSATSPSLMSTTDNLFDNNICINGAVTDNELCVGVDNFVDGGNGSVSESLTGTKRDYISAAFKQLAQNTSNQIRVCAEYTYSYNGKTIKSVGVYSQWYNIAEDSLYSTVFSVNGVDFSSGNDGIIFY